MYREPMSIRRSIVEELLDTIFFGGLSNVKGPRFRKVKTKDKDAYMVHFGAVGLVGAILVHSPRKIEVFYKKDGFEYKELCRSTYETKWFMVQAFVS